MKILVRGGGDLASGAIARAHRAGWDVIVTELPGPLAVRRTVSFAQAVYSGEIAIEEIRARMVSNMDAVNEALSQRVVPVIVDPGAEIRGEFVPDVIVDARMRKAPSDLPLRSAPLVIGLGPGFHAGNDVDAVVETVRGSRLGRVYWLGTAQADTGLPERVAGFSAERVLRAPASGPVETVRAIGDICKKNEIIARVAGKMILAPFDGVLRGLVQEGLVVPEGMKIGDLDPRNDPGLCWLISDKALAIGGGVLEAVLTWQARQK